MNKIILITLIFFNSLSLVAQDSIHVPNIFTPNNDNVNEFFFVRTKGYEELVCTIFNRYGETIYRYYGLNGNWDGFTHAGVKVPNGTYFVLVEAKKEDGTVETRQSTLQVQY